VTAGVMYVDHPIAGDQALSLVRLLANQAAGAVQNSQLYEVSAIDLLTETHTRPFLEQALARELAASMRGGHAVALVAIDIDNLKSINEQAGHVAGDQALRALGRVLRQVTRAGDIVGRLDGDSFGIVLRNPLIVGPARLASRVRELLKGQTIDGVDGKLPIQVSIGFSFVEPYGRKEEQAARRPGGAFFSEMAEKLLASAIAGVTEAQAAGGNTVRGSEPLVWP